MQSINVSQTAFIMPNLTVTLFIKILAADTTVTNVAENTNILTTFNGSMNWNYLARAIIH